jgi:WD40 repeat protein
VSSPAWWLGTGAVGAGRDIRGPVTVNVIAGTFDRLHDAIFDPKPLWDALDLERFTGRKLLVKEIEDHVATHRKGYVLVRGEAGVGKSALAAHLVWTRPCIHHFTSLPGARNPEAARRSLSAQLIGACGLAERLVPGDAFPAVADRPDWLLKILQAAAQCRDQIQPAGPLVLVVDGLDEDTGIPLGLPRPEHLPDGVFVVATSRFGLPLPALLGSALLRVIEADSDQNRHDMSGFVMGATAGSGADARLVDRLLARGVAPDNFAGDLVERCAGIWIYLKYVLDDVRHGRRDPADLESLPVRLAGYYLEQVERWRCCEDWRSAGLPALATLAALHRSVTVRELAGFSAVAEDSLGEWLDVRLRPFLVVTRDQRSRICYAVRHQSLRDLFEPGGEGEWDYDFGHRHALPDALVAAHRRIAGVLTPPSIDGHREWDRIDAYARSELAGHAAACGALDELVSEAGLLLAASPASILRQSPAVHSAEGRAALAAYRLTLGDRTGENAATRAWKLHVWARKTRAQRLGTAALRLSGSTWAVERASWQGSVHMVLGSHQGEVLSVAVGRLSGRDVVVSGGEDGTVRVWEPGSEAEPQVLSGLQSEVSSVAVGRLSGRDAVVSGSEDGTVRVWEPGSGAEPLVLSGRQGWVWSVAMGRLSGRDVVVSGGEDGTVRVWEPGSEAEAPLLGSHHGLVWSVAVGCLSGLDVVVSGGEDGTVRVWEPGSEAEPLTQYGYQGRVRSVAVGRLSGRDVVVSGGQDGTVRVWEPGSEAKPLVLSGHQGWVRSVAVGRLSGRDVVVSGGQDGTVRVWEPGSETEPLVLSGHEGRVSSVALGNLSERDVIVSGGEDGAILIWVPVRAEEWGRQSAGRRPPEG